MTKFAKNTRMKQWIVPVLFVFIAACINNTDKEKSARVNGADSSAPDVAVASPTPPITQTFDSTRITSIEWLDSTKKLSPVTEGDIVKISYRFRNSGKRPLVIERVAPACGCTVADYPKQAIAPGQEAEIKAEFDSHGREGVQNKNLTVFANTREQSYTLYFSVTVNKKS